VFSKPFDGEARIETKGFGHVSLRLIRLAQERISGGQAYVDPVGVIAGVERLSVCDDRGFGTTGAKLNVAELPIKRRSRRIMWAQANRLLQVGLSLVETTEGYFGARSRTVEILIVRIDGEADVSAFLNSLEVGDHMRFVTRQKRQLGGAQQILCGVLNGPCAAKAPDEGLRLGV
jgi:hypothetical protein